MRLTIRVAYIFYFFTLSKGIDDAQSFLGYVLSTKLFFRIRFSSASRAHPSQEENRRQKVVNRGLCDCAGSLTLKIGKNSTDL